MDLSDAIPSDSHGSDAIATGDQPARVESIEAFDRMVQHAQSLGADAVIGVRFETTDAGQGQATEVLAYGTAVKL